MIENDIEIYFDRLWTICRSITGNGLRESFKIIQGLIPLNLYEVPTGTKCFDWEVPKEWNINDAYILTPTGEKICDFRINNLHILNYSIPFEGYVDFEELDKHLFSLPELPYAIPYVTSYYKENWGFCISHDLRMQLPKDGKYYIKIDSSLEHGFLTYGDLVLKGETDQEILFSTYLCHPSMANNELSGPLCLAFLYQKIAALPKRKYTYRFVVAPETIGVIAYLSKNGFYMKDNIVAGYVMTCCGDDAPFVYKMSKHENSLADRIAKHVLKNQSIPYEIIPFAVGGSDERQYCSPGFNMPVGSLTRSMYQRYKEYHTSLDKKEFISFVAMEKTIEVYFDFVRVLEINDFYKTTIPYCEPQLGKRGLYPSSVNPNYDRMNVHRMMHLISFSDGNTDLVDVAELRKESVFKYQEILIDLLNSKLLVTSN
jgi:aminopeptidase-like protein